MIFHRIKSGGIAHNSYFIGLDGKAAVIDPRRDCEVYLDLARRHEMSITHILETHRNEDYVVGSKELAVLAGAEVYHGAGLAWGYGMNVHDGDTFDIGGLRLSALATPGHTGESVSYALTDLDSGSATVMVFTGDTLFVNDAGRTDLFGPEKAVELAEALYESIHQKLLPLGDGVILCPGHGAGSVCGVNIADRDESTLGIERMQNPLLRFENKEAFVAFKSAEKLERPRYFRKMEVYNLEGPPLLGRLPAPHALSASEFRDRTCGEGEVVVVDTRLSASFGGAHLEHSYNIWLDGLPVFGGWVLPYNTPLLLVTETQDDVEQAVRYLVRAGYDSIRGYLSGGIEQWYEAGFPVGKLPLLSVKELKERLEKQDGTVVLDVRDDNEWDAGHIEDALHIYVGHLEDRIAEIPRDRPVAVMCTVGHRASLGASILLREGFTNVANVLGGETAWNTAGYPLVK